ncbi:MAG: cell wall anchor protein, partial [Flavobacterium sp.]
TGNYRLYVEGGILTEKVKVALRSTANWADYVFADDYRLMPLNEVEAFIQKNKHLPGVASAETLAKEGLDVAAMQAKHMEKIEELTLYVIDQNKTIQAQQATLTQQQKEINQLKAQLALLIQKMK